MGPPLCDTWKIARFPELLGHILTLEAPAREFKALDLGIDVICVRNRKFSFKGLDVLCIVVMEVC